MKIIVMNSADLRIEVIKVSDQLIEDDDIEQFLSERGYSLNNISWMTAPVDYVPVKFHDYGVCSTDGQEIHVERDARLKDFSIYDSVREVKRREQEELVKKLHRYGKHEEDYFEWRFDGECPCVAAYDYEEPCDVVVLAARVDEDGDITIYGDDKNDRGNLHEIDVDEIFAGQLDFVTSAIG